jgi:hypothetical protein
LAMIARKAESARLRTRLLETRAETTTTPETTTTRRRELLASSRKRRRAPARPPFMSAICLLI